RRQKTQRKQRVAEQVATEPGSEPDERRVVHVAPGKVFAASCIIQLIAKVAVFSVEEEMKHDAERRETVHPCRQRRSARGRFSQFIHKKRNPSSLMATDYTRHT